MAPLKDTGVHQLHFDSVQEPAQVYKSCTSSGVELGVLLKKKKCVELQVNKTLVEVFPHKRNRSLALKFSHVLLVSPAGVKTGNHFCGCVPC